MSLPSSNLGTWYCTLHTQYTVGHTQHTVGHTNYASEGEESSVPPPTNESLLLTTGVADCGLDPEALQRVGIYLLSSISQPALAWPLSSPTLPHSSDIVVEIARVAAWLLGYGWGLRPPACVLGYSVQWLRDGWHFGL